MSRKSRSGLALRISSAASTPEPHSPTMAISGSCRSSTVRLLRASGSSSTITVRIFIGGTCADMDLFLEPHGDGYVYHVRLLILQVQLESVSVQALKTSSHIRDPNPRLSSLPARRQTGAV